MMNSLTTNIILNNLSYDKQIELYEAIKKKYNFDGYMFVHFAWKNLCDYGNAPQILFQCKKSDLGQKIKEYFIDLYEEEIIKNSEWFIKIFDNICNLLVEKKTSNFAKLLEIYERAYDWFYWLEDYYIYGLEKYFTFDTKKYLQSNNEDKIELIRLFLMDRCDYYCNNPYSVFGYNLLWEKDGYLYYPLRRFAIIDSFDKFNKIVLECHTFH